MRSIRLAFGRWSLAILCALGADPAVGRGAPEAPAPDRIRVTLQGVWQGKTFGASADDPLVRLMRADPSIRADEWSSLALPGGAFRATLMMSMAGQTAPDVFLSFFHSIRNDLHQGFNHPLNEWIGRDRNGNGRVDPDEARWPGWTNVPALWRDVATDAGNVYALPTASIVHYAIVFRRDLVQRAGLDADRPPATWDEFLYWCQKLTDPGRKIRGVSLQRGQCGFALPIHSWLWIAWMQSAGGSPVVQERTSPTTGRTYTFPMEETAFRAPDTGEDLRGVPSVWRAGFASEAGLQALDFFHRLRWQRWIRDPVTQEPINLTPDQARAGTVTLPDGRVVRFAREDVIVGCVRVALGQDLRDAQFWFARGEVAMQQGPFDDLAEYAAQVNPSLLGVFPVPAGPGPGGRPVVGVFRHFTAMSEGVGRRPKRERDAVWKVLTALTSPEARDENIRRRVLNGHACFVDPADLRRLGYADYIPEVPASLRRLYEGLEDGAILARTEPFVGHSTAVFMALNANVLSPMLAASGEGFDYRRALADEEHAANTGVLVERPRETLAPYRPLAWAVLAVAALAMGFLVTRIIRHELGKSAAGTGASRAGVYRPWLPWLMLAPALGSVALWGYYPLLRGMVMAFQDYRIVGHSPWVGLDNFITVFQNPDFYIHVRQTLKFVALNLLLVFTAPILLSLLLSEIPRGKVFWRSVFSLPQLTSGLVIVLLWKLMYSPAETGLLNRVVALFGGKARDWLGDPRTAMLAVIVPSVWAGMGISSLIYLAALKCVPDELYEAATLDGAGVRRKLWSITLPQLMPLILINFVGAFIGTFQSMGSILLLTFGGPGKETMVLSMAIWMEAYTNLRFSTATAMAWILGSALIGFAYLQIRMLRRVEFRRVEEV